MAAAPPPATSVDTPDSIAAGADSTGASGQSGSDTAAPTRHHPWRRAARAAALGTVLGLALLAGGLGWLWHWAGSEGSLASTLQWVGARWPLSSQQVSGSLLHGGHAGQLAWRQDGLQVHIDDATLRWAPAALLRRTLHIQQLAAARVRIDDQRPPSPSTGAPPAALGLPLHVRIDALRVDELAWAGPPALSLHEVAGAYAFDGARHTLDLSHARFQDGRYQARATLGAQAPMPLDVALAGALRTEVPGGGAPTALRLRARLHGPLAELQAQAVALAAADAATPTLPALPAADTPLALPADADGAQAQLSARITPWAAQPLPEAQVRLQAIDARAFWPSAPHTRLSGQAELAPLAGAPGWRITADLRNADAGPWDHQRLPVEALQADGQWQDGIATIERLQARLAGGTLQASGRWASAADARWQLDARAADIDPARLHSQLAAAPIGGTTQLQGQGAALDFTLALQARPAPAAPAKGLRALDLRSAHARGRWAEGWLTLQQLDMRAGSAQLAGNARLHLLDRRAPSGSADLTLTAPGLQAHVQGNLGATRGEGKAQLDVSDAARTLAWAQTLPGAAPLLAGLQARGAATLQARWHGGWQDPELHARLSAPSLQAQRAQDAAPWQLQGAELTLDGRLAQAHATLRGALQQGPRQIELQAAADLARSTPKATLAASTWRLQLQQLQAKVSDPALGAGAWQLASAQPFTLQGVAAARGPLQLSAGALTLTSPAPVQQARLDWGPLRWQGGALASTGRLTGLPLQWAERLAGVKLADYGIEGALLFDGQWDLNWDDRLRLRAELARASGDLTLVARDTDTGLAARVPAGLRQARLQLASDGPAVTARLDWDSAEAGQAQGELRTQLSAAPDGQGGTRWSWPASAPLGGQLQARLPRIAAWSALAPPGWRLRGALAADVRVAGTRGQPQVTGTLSADDLALRSVVDGFALGRQRLRARLDGTQLIVDELLLHGPDGGKGAPADAGGTLRASGAAGWQDGRAQARLDVTLTRLHASVRADRDLTVSGQVQAALAGRQITVGGDLRVDRGRIELPDDSAPSLGSDVVVHGAKTAASAPAAAPPPASPLTVDARVQLDMGEDLRVRGQGLETRLAGSLQLSAQGPIGTPPQLAGTIRTVGGRFHAYSQNLDIARGAISFSGAVDNPRLDIVALRPIFTADQRVGVQVAGSALLPRVRLYSEPPLPDNQALAWLLLGRAAPATGAESAMLQSAAVALLGGREGRGLAARFGLDELSFARGSDSASPDGSVGGASVTLGKRLSERLYAAYQHSLAGTSGALLIFYELSRRWSLRAQAGENAALDLIYRLSFD
ncbi:translocation/assembly module TamB domain-containing protein [Ottowia pentelensis]|uniref:translocation/assembly module TamB domain-containing protein n=1 Tax=Ottowia pentelensis TaxID=511108 RepID=UPI00360A5D40